jgi:ABC-type proline/glycine betaine transport system permease subunit
MISEHDMSPQAGEELVSHLLFVVIAAILGAVIGVGLCAWLMSHWALTLIG